MYIPQMCMSSEVTCKVIEVVVLSLACARSPDRIYFSRVDSTSYRTTSVVVLPDTGLHGVVVVVDCSLL